MAVIRALRTIRKITALKKLPGEPGSPPRGAGQNFWVSGPKEKRWAVRGAEARGVVVAYAEASEPAAHNWPSTFVTFHSSSVFAPPPKVKRRIFSTHAATPAV